MGKYISEYEINIPTLKRVFLSYILIQNWFPNYRLTVKLTATNTYKCTCHLNYAVKTVSKLRSVVFSQAFPKLIKHKILFFK